MSVVQYLLMQGSDPSHILKVCPVVWGGGGVYVGGRRGVCGWGYTYLIMQASVLVYRSALAINFVPTFVRVLLCNLVAMLSLKCT